MRQAAQKLGQWDQRSTYPPLRPFPHCRNKPFCVRMPGCGEYALYWAAFHNLTLMQNGEAVETLTASQLIGHRVSADYTRNLLRASEGFVRA